MPKFVKISRQIKKISNYIYFIPPETAIAIKLKLTSNRRDNIFKLVVFFNIEISIRLNLYYKEYIEISFLT